MKSQHLVVDTVRNWHRLSNDGCFQTRETGSFKLTLVTVPVEFEGTEEFKAIVLWGEAQPVPNPKGAERSDLHKEIFDVIKKFAIGVNAKITEVKHDHLTTFGCPHPGFAQGQGHMVVIAAFAAAYTGKRCIHRAFVRITGHDTATECRRKSRYRSKLCATQFALPAGRMESHSVTYAFLLFLL